ncbi:MAG: hypothetical protein D3909_06075 [Candidatus Electrothrix sp. ATG1]|nr:hypothetical protein [Candidatus Electrothrix sp. ATG1]
MDVDFPGNKFDTSLYHFKIKSYFSASTHIVVLIVFFSILPQRKKHFIPKKPPLNNQLLLKELLTKKCKYVLNKSLRKKSINNIRRVRSVNI